MSSKKLLKKSKNHHKFKELDEESLSAIMRTAVKEGSPGYDKVRFVLQVASDEILCFASRRRAFGEKGQTSTSKEQLAEAAGLEPAAAVKAGLQDGGESCVRTKAGGKTHPPADGKVKRNGNLKAVKRVLPRS